MLLFVLYTRRRIYLSTRRCCSLWEVRVHSFASIYRKETPHRFLKRAVRKCDFPIQQQWDVDRVVVEAQKLVASNNNLHIPGSPRNLHGPLPLPRGLPVKNSGKRRRSWYERCPNLSNKHSYTCSFCQMKAHTARNCEWCEISFGKRSTCSQVLEENREHTKEPTGNPHQKDDPNDDQSEK